jgi:pimeloyl-ACP methyl ester carboxylesterase
MQRDIYKKGIPVARPISSLPSFSHEEEEEEDKWTPVSWDKYFDSMQDISIPDTEDVFRVYFAGAGDGPVFVLFHGGGHTSLSWALTVGHMKDHARLVAFDFRAHGATKTKDEKDLSIERLTQDGINVINTIFKDQDPHPILFLVGHSLGGAVAVHVATSTQVQNIGALVVLDVVEGTAMASLKTMDLYLAKLPESFPSLKKAIQWSVRSGAIRNTESPPVSIPPRLVWSEEDQKFRWRTDLRATKPYWSAWYHGLSRRFLSCRSTKVLILAGTDRLDTELTIAQMQGKFRLVVLPDCGHCIQEDNPEKTAEILLDITKRFEVVASRGITLG